MGNFKKITALLLALACCPGPLNAQDASQRFMASLEQARQNWREGDDLAAQLAHAALNVGAAEFQRLIDQRRTAYENATALFEKALDADPQNAQALAEFGRFWAAQKDFGLARHFYESAWTAFYPPPGTKDAPQTSKDNALTPFNPEHCGPRAERELSAADKADLLRNLGGIAERAGEVPVALALYRLALERNAADARNRVSMAVALCAAGTPAGALEVLLPKGAERSAGLDETMFKDHPQVYALAEYTLGYIHEELGLMEAALRDYQRAQDLAHVSGGADNDVAENSRMAVNRLKEREEDLDANRKEVEEKAPERERVINNTARSFNAKPFDVKPERQLFEDARAACERAVKSKNQALADPDFAELLEQVRTNRMTAAKLEEVKEDEKGFSGLRLFQEAEKTMDNAIARFSRYPRLNFELAALKLQLRRYTQARQYLDAAEIYSPNDVAVLSLRGGVLLEMGQWEDAAIAFRKLLTLDHENGAANFGLGRALAALRSNEIVCSNALDAFARAVKLGVRDERLFRSSTLVLKDGQKLDGWIKQVGNDYVVIKEGEAPFRIEAAQAEKLEHGPGLRQFMIETLIKYQHGERPPALERVVGRRNRQDDLQSPGRENSIFGP